MRQLGVVLLTLVIGLLPGVGLLLPAAAQTAEVVVGDGDYACNYKGLAAAIADAPSSATISFNCTATIIVFESNIWITKTLIIDGSNAGGDAITFGGNDQTNMFIVLEDGDLTVQQLTFTNGNAPPGSNVYVEGGAIDGDGGNITVLRCTFTKNQAEIGGAIDNDGGMLRISQSTFTKNQADHGGGAIWNDGPLGIFRSSFVANHAGKVSGAIVAARGSLILIASTLTGNTADISGSAIVVSNLVDAASIRWSTIVQPEGTTPALYIEDRPYFYLPPTLEGVILAGPGHNCELQSTATITIDRSTISDDNSCSLDAESSMVVDPGLDEVATATVHGVVQTYYPLLESSPAVDSGGLICLPSDQIGDARPFGGTCDIGAIESPWNRNTSPTIRDIAISTPTVEGHAITFTVTAFDIDADELTYAVDCTNNGDFEIAEATSNQLTCTYPNNGDYTVHVQVSDGTVNAAQDVPVTIANVAPHDVTISANSLQVVFGQPVALQLRASDVPADTLNFSYVCDNDTSGSVPDVSSTDGSFAAEVSCSYDQVGSHTISLTATDDDGGSAQAESIVIQVFEPVDLCANRWSGDLRMPPSERCASTETLLHIAFDSPVTLCANRWTGEARYSQYGRCRTTETAYEATGMNTVPVCVNRWDGTVRISERCYSTERSDAV